MNFLRGVSRRAAVGAALLATTAIDPSGAAMAQQPTGNITIGPDSLRDFSLTPQRRIVTQPSPTATPPAATPTLPPAPPPTVQPATPPAGTSRPVPNPTAPTTTPRAAPQPTPRQPTSTAPGPTPQAQPAAPVPQGEAAPAPLPTAPTPNAAPPPAAEPPVAAPAPVPSQPSEGIPPWVYGLGVAALLIGAVLFLRHRRNATLALPAADEAFEETGAEQPVPQPSIPRVPRPDPLPRPWIELDLVAERATADAQESVVEFALTIRNSGGSIARNLKLQAKLICGTLTQDEEISAFQRKKPGEHRTISLPDLPAGEEITIQGRVDSKGDELKALRVEQKLLFIPLVVVNAFYDWNSSRTGQTSKSFLVGREKPDPNERMAPFRLDLGPRVYRTVGQRPYKIGKRV